MKYILLLVGMTSILMSCEQPHIEKTWQFAETITLDEIHPIGLTETSEGIWLSDGDHKRIVLINAKGAIIKSIDSLERPMHIASFNDELLIPLYGQDEVLRRKGDELSAIVVSDSLDAPAGVWQEGNAIAIADFYSHRILMTQDGSDWISIGKEGNADGEFYYPTDVQIYNDTLWVADAYNNRLQLFDMKGTFLKMVGVNEKMNAATGIYVSENEFFTTDFENNRVLVYNHQGELIQELKSKIQKPTDILISNGELIIANYRNAQLVKYQLLPKPEHAEEEEHDHAEEEHGHEKGHEEEHEDEHDEEDEHDHED